MHVSPVASLKVVTHIVIEVLSYFYIWTVVTLFKNKYDPCGLLIS